jgi:hypothetical protein
MCAGLATLRGRAACPPNEQDWYRGQKSSVPGRVFLLLVEQTAQRSSTFQNENTRLLLYGAAGLLPVI